MKNKLCPCSELEWLPEMMTLEHHPDCAAGKPEPPRHHSVEWQYKEKSKIMASERQVDSTVDQIDRFIKFQRNPLVNQTLTALRERGIECEVNYDFTSSPIIVTLIKGDFRCRIESNPRNPERSFALLCLRYEKIRSELTPELLTIVDQLYHTIPQDRIDLIIRQI